MKKFIAVPLGIIGSIAAFLLMQDVFAGRIILDPVAMRIGSLSIHWYGITMALAIGVAYLVAELRLHQRGIATSSSDQLLWWGIVAGLIGARLGFVAQNLDYFTEIPAQMFAVNQGGLSIHGAVVFGAVAVLTIARHHKLNGWLVADAIAPAILLGAIIGRIGNFCNYELYGYPTSVAWKMFVPIFYRLPGYETFNFFHPTFLYEMLLNALMLGLMLWVEQHRKLSIGNMAIATIIGYSASRFVVEFFRIGAPIGGGLTLAQWVSLGAVFVGAVLVWRKGVHGRR